MEPNKEGLSTAIDKLVEKAVTERFPDGEPEPKLFSEGYRKALTDYNQYRVRKAMRRASLK